MVSTELYFAESKESTNTLLEHKYLYIRANPSYGHCWFILEIRTEIVVMWKSNKKNGNYNNSHINDDHVENMVYEYFVSLTW